jgi:hypothetical protein
MYAANWIPNAIKFVGSPILITFTILRLSYRCRVSRAGVQFRNAIYLGSLPTAAYLQSIPLVMSGNVALWRIVEDRDRARGGTLDISSPELVLSNRLTMRSPCNPSMWYQTIPHRRGCHCTSGIHSLLSRCCVSRAVFGCCHPRVVPTVWSCVGRFVD